MTSNLEIEVNMEKCCYEKFGKATGVRNEANWKRNIRKARRHKGLAYTSRSGKHVEERRVREPCSDCNFKCAEHFNEDKRQGIFDAYWKSANFYCQRDFINSNIEIVKPESGAERIRVSRKYFLPNGDNKVQVCFKFFCNTLDVKEKLIRYTLKKRKCGGFREIKTKHTPHNKSSEADLNKVKMHIDKFPRIASHCCRCTSSCQYLPGELNITKMYNMYVEETDNPLSINVYRKVFKYDFNLGFHQQKQDLCQECVAFDNQSDTERPQTRPAHKKQLPLKNSCRKNEEKDKGRGSKNDSFCSATFDFQHVLSTPSGNALHHFITNLNSQHTCQT